MTALLFLDFLDNLAKALGNSEGQTTEEIRTELEAEGIDVDACLHRFLQHVRHCSIAAERVWLEMNTDSSAEEFKWRELEPEEMEKFQQAVVDTMKATEQFKEKLRKRELRRQERLRR